MSNKVSEQSNDSPRKSTADKLEHVKEAVVGRVRRAKSRVLGEKDKTTEDDPKEIEEKISEKTNDHSERDEIANHKKKNSKDRHEKKVKREKLKHRPEYDDDPFKGENPAKEMNLEKIIITNARDVHGFPIEPSMSNTPNWILNSSSEDSTKEEHSLDKKEKDNHDHLDKNSDKEKKKKKKEKDRLSQGYLADISEKTEKNSTQKGHKEKYHELLQWSAIDRLPHQYSNSDITEQVKKEKVKQEKDSDTEKDEDPQTNGDRLDNSLLIKDLREQSYRLSSQNDKLGKDLNLDSKDLRYKRNIMDKDLRARDHPVKQSDHLNKDLHTKDHPVKQSDHLNNDLHTKDYPVKQSDHLNKDLYSKDHLDKNLHSKDRTEKHDNLDLFEMHSDDRLPPINHMEKCEKGLLENKDKSPREIHAKDLLERKRIENELLEIEKKERREQQEKAVLEKHEKDLQERKIRKSERDKKVKNKQDNSEKHSKDARAENIITPNNAKAKEMHSKDWKLNEEKEKKKEHLDRDKSGRKDKKEKHSRDRLEHGKSNDQMAKEMHENDDKSTSQKKYRKDKKEKHSKDRLDHGKSNDQMAKEMHEKILAEER